MKQENLKPESFRPFITHGNMNRCQDNAFAKILDETKAKPLLRFFKDHRAQFPGLEDQIAMALIQAIQRKNVRWSALLLWAGAEHRWQIVRLFRNPTSRNNSKKSMNKHGDGKNRIS